MRFVWLLLCFLLILTVPAFAGDPGSRASVVAADPEDSPTAPDASRFRSACSRGEAWAFSSRIDAGWQEGFNEYLSRHMSPVRGFSEAMALRAQAKTEEAKLFGEYWASRALLDAGLPHIAEVGFSSIAGREAEGPAQAVQIAALQCLIEIQKKIPSLSLPAKVAERIYSFPKYAVTWEAAASHFRDEIAEGASASQMEKTLRYMAGGGVYEAFSQAMYAAYLGRQTDTVAWMSRYFQDPDAGSMKRYADVAHMILSRAYFSLKQYESAVTELKAVKKSSNELSHALSELSWAYLKDGKYQEAVGTATNLQAGGLKNTFAPEPQMVMAMAFNELCYFPESLHAMQQFKGSYGPSYEWLQNWEKTSKGGDNLYALALAQIKHTGKVPAKVANEWLRSPLFYSRQEEINSIFEERRSVDELGNAGARELHKMAVALLKLVGEIKPMYLRAKADAPDGPLPPELEEDLVKLRKSVTAYRRLKRGAEPWKRILAYFQKTSPGAEKKLVRSISQDLARMNERMLAQLEEVADNTRFIEVEIYNGASQDMVWQNAHPDFKEVSKEISEENDRRPAGAAVWDWGTVSGNSAGSEEIWEDELGSFRAELQDNCGNRERYLAIKKTHRTTSKGDSP